MNGIEYAAALRLIADWYESHPEAATPHDGEMNIFSAHTKEQAEWVARALAPCRKEFTSAEQFFIWRDFGGIKLRFCFSRSVVCERVVVGTEEVPAYTVPAHIKETVEWKCAPIFEATEP